MKSVLCIIVPFLCRFKHWDYPMTVLLHYDVSKTYLSHVWHSSIHYNYHIFTSAMGPLVCGHLVHFTSCSGDSVCNSPHVIFLTWSLCVFTCLMSHEPTANELTSIFQTEIIFHWQFTVERGWVQTLCTFIQCCVVFSSWIFVCCWDQSHVSLNYDVPTLSSQYLNT